MVKYCNDCRWRTKSYSCPCNTYSHTHTYSQTLSFFLSLSQIDSHSLTQTATRDVKRICWTFWTFCHFFKKCVKDMHKCHDVWRPLLLWRKCHTSGLFDWEIAFFPLCDTFFSRLFSLVIAVYIKKSVLQKTTTLQLSSRTNIESRSWIGYSICLFGKKYVDIIKSNSQRQKIRNWSS